MVQNQDSSTGPDMIDFDVLTYKDTKINNALKHKKGRPAGRHSLKTSQMDNIPNGDQRCWSTLQKQTFFYQSRLRKVLSQA